MPSSSSDQTPQDAPRSPFAGCLILIVMAIVVLVLIASAAFSVKKQTDAFKTFTETVAEPAPITETTDQEAEVNSLINRLRHFEHELENKRPGELALSANDLNLAIAQFEVLSAFRGQLSIASITNQELTGRIHYPFNSTAKLPGFIRSLLNIEARENNLNGTFSATPLLTDGKLILNLTKITPSQGEIPEELFSSISRTLISGELEKQAEDNPEDLPPLLSKLRQLTGLAIRADQLVFSYAPDLEPPSVQQEADEMATKAKQLVALGAVIFILTMILFFIILSRRQKMKRENRRRS